MPILRSDIEKALDELISQEEWSRFQGLAVVLGKSRWPRLVAHPRKKDLGLDAYVPAWDTEEKIGKGLAASITPDLGKISDDAKRAKENYPDLGALLFVTPAKVGKTKQRQWEDAIHNNHGLELLVVEREEIIVLMTMPENASLCATYLHLDVDAEPDVEELVRRTKRAAEEVTRTWARNPRGHPLIELTAVRVEHDGADSAEVLSLDQIDEALSKSGRIVLEGPAGRGKTTTLIQLAQRERRAGIPFMVDLAPWTTSRRNILEFIAGGPAFQAEGLMSADLARVQQTEPFLFLLNGWNEIAEASSRQASEALRELEREFPGAGIIVATRTHHLVPPLPSALRMRLLPVGRDERAGYLEARLGEKAAELQSRIDVDPSLDGLTRTPFILSEVTLLFEAGTEIPTTKLGILAEVQHLHEQREGHRNALQDGPIYGQQAAFLKALATEMTHHGAVGLTEEDAGTVVAAVARELLNRGRIEPAVATRILANLTAHHILERVEYPETFFQFEHQQFQEHYAALDVRDQLVELDGDDQDARDRFTAGYVNVPAWAEPLRMIAEALAEQSGEEGTDRRSTLAGSVLVEMALEVDLVFAGELALLCGTAVWNEVGVVVGERLRAVCELPDRDFRQIAIAAMLASGSDDFGDIILPLLSGEDKQARLRTYRLWPDLRLSSLGPNWREEVRGWSEEARENFVSELLHHRVDEEVTSFAVEDNSAAVKKAAVSGLIWTGSEGPLTLVLESMNAEDFEDVSRNQTTRMPPILRANAVAAMRRHVERAEVPSARLGTALHLIEHGEHGLGAVVKDVLEQPPDEGMLGRIAHLIEPALGYLQRTDPAWTSEWVVRQIADGALYRQEEWLRFATVIPDDLVERYLRRLETEDLGHARLDGTVAVIAAGADAKLAARVFSGVRDLRRRVDAEPGERHEYEWQVMRQLGAVFRGLPDDIVAEGILSSVTDGDALDIRVATDLLSKVARPDQEPLRVVDNELREGLRAYLKSSVNLVLRQDDFNGGEKADLASSIAQVGMPEDMEDLVALIRADIERVRRGLAARAAGEHGPLANGAIMSYAGWHISAVLQLDPAGADQVLIELLSEPEYSSDAAGAMARDFVPMHGHGFQRKFRHDLLWAAREGGTPSLGEEPRRTRLATALKDEIKRLQDQEREGGLGSNATRLATALAAIDGLGSAETVFEAIGNPRRWDEYTCLDAAERLLMAGVVLPVPIAFALVDSVLGRTEHWMSDSDRYLLRQVLSLCPFVDDPAAGIAKMRDVLGDRRLGGYELNELIIALGESRSEAALGLLSELAADAQTFEQCEHELINAIATLDSPGARELLLGTVDPDIRGLTLPRQLHGEETLITRLNELVEHGPEVAERLRGLCERDLPVTNRHLLSRVMGRFGTPEAVLANLKLIDDARRPPVPRGVQEQLEMAFVERRPYRGDPNAFTLHARAVNEIRAGLFRMAHEDRKRQESAFRLLGQIELWRLEYGRPTDEPRHPDLASGQSWPIHEA